MYYGYYPYGGWPSPWGPPMGMCYPMEGHGLIPMEVCHRCPLTHHQEGMEHQECHPMGNLIIHHRGDLGHQVCHPMVHLWHQSRR